MDISKKSEIIENSILIALHKISHQIYNRHNELLQKYNLTVQQARILGFLSCNRDNEFINQKDVERHMDLRGSTISSLIKYLLEKEYIEKTKNLDDGRYFNLKITSKGLELDKVIFHIFNDFEETVLKDIPSKDLEITRKSLDLIKGKIF